MEAVEARKVATEKLNSVVQEDQYQWVKQGIQDYVNIGKYRYWIDGTLHESVKERLRSEGFKVSDKFLKDLAGTTITW